MGALLGLLLGLGVVLIVTLAHHGAPGPRPSRLAAAAAGRSRPGRHRGRQPRPARRAPRRRWVSSRSSSSSAPAACSSSASPSACSPRLLPVTLVRRRRALRQAELREIWPEAVDNLASGVRAGLSLPEALTQLGVRGPEQLRSAVRQVRRGLPRHRPVRRVARPPQGQPRRPGRGPGGRGPADGPRGRWHRPRTAAADAERVPARGRADPGRARDAAGLDGQRRPAGAWPRHGSCCCCCRPSRPQSRRTTSRPGRWCCSSGAWSAALAYRLMLRIARLPAERRVLR